MKEYKTVITESTDPFFFTVYANSREAEISAWGWTPEEQGEFLRMQYQCQQRSYQMQYPDLESRIIYVENTPAGRILLAQTETGRVLVDISLLTEFQNRGIGHALLRELQEEMRPGESLRLAVLKSNPARRFYERLGFQLLQAGEPYLTMIWRKSEPDN